MTFLGVEAFKWFIVFTVSLQEALCDAVAKALTDL